jgi:hypothetical protein
MQNAKGKMQKAKGQSLKCNRPPHADLLSSATDFTPQDVAADGADAPHFCILHFAF